ncbi:MAG: hypothetical protein E6I82_07275, partial [Chloroflexi bacterium]
MEQGLEAVAYFDPPNLVWPFGAHVCVVEVDPETGAVEIQKYVAVDDCGNIINPTIVEGQIHGGVTQGIGQALFEEMIYDEESGQLKTGTLIDYSVPTANEIPNLITDNTVTPSPTNELGVKGIGEAGTIAASAAVINAISDALTPFGIKQPALGADQGGTQVIPAAFEYARASSVEEASKLLGKYGEDAKVLAGGHSLIPLMRLRLAQPSALVDINGIKDLDHIKEDGQKLRIGALTRHVTIQNSKVVKDKLPLLAEVAGEVGDNQVRNMGTMGGVIAHADAAGDYPTLALILEAEIVTNLRTIPARDFFQ